MDFIIENFQTMHAALKEMCADFMRESVSEEAVFNSKLVASELLSNVLQHGGARAFFRVILTQDRIILFVRGENDFCPPKESVCASVDDACGRGLYLVDALCMQRDYSKENGIRVELRRS